MKPGPVIDIETAPVRAGAAGAGGMGLLILGAAVAAYFALGK